MERLDLNTLISGLIVEAGKLNNSAPLNDLTVFTIKMTASQVCASFAQALINASKSGDTA